MVLDGLSFSIAPNHKTGIVGRTGSGKSSLLLSILRIVEMDIESEGSSEDLDSFIKIDGQKISDIGLHFLRKSLAIIPQDPFLFQGTLMKNVDPLGEFSKSDIISALKTVRFQQTLKQKPDSANLYPNPRANLGSKLETLPAHQQYLDSNNNLVEEDDQAD